MKHNSRKRFSRDIPVQNKYMHDTVVSGMKRLFVGKVKQVLHYKIGKTKVLMVIGEVLLQALLI